MMDCVNGVRPFVLEDMQILSRKHTHIRYTLAGSGPGLKFSEEEL
jgi:hypothetical protein